MNKSVTVMMMVMVAVWAVGSPKEVSPWSGSGEVGVTFSDRVGYAAGGSVIYDLNKDWSAVITGLYMDAMTDLDENVKNGDVYLTPQGMVTLGLRRDWVMPNEYKEITLSASVAGGAIIIEQDMAAWGYWDDGTKKIPATPTTPEVPAVAPKYYEVDSENESDITGVLSATIEVKIAPKDIGKNLSFGCTVMQTAPVDFVDDGQLVNADWDPVVGRDEYTSSLVMFFFRTEF